MSATAIMPKTQHVQLHIDVEPETEVFQYNGVGETGETVGGRILRVHHGDSVTFQSKYRFLLEFRESPFEPAWKTLLQAEPRGGHWIIPADVRGDAPFKDYHYAVDIPGIGRDDPEVILEQF